MLATTSSPEKRQFLTDCYGISSGDIFYSRDSSFVQGVLAATGGEGVDVIVNSLTGDLLHSSWDVLAAFGRFIEVGKHDIVECGKLGMKAFEKGVTFSAFDLSELHYSEKPLHRRAGRR